MGRVKVPRCDNCGAPVEFAGGVLEARCEYCGEVLIREPPAPAPAPPPVAPQWQAPPRTAPRAATTAKVWPYVITGAAMLTMAGASGLANFAAQMKPLPLPVPATEAKTILVPDLEHRAGQESTTVKRTELRGESASKSVDAGTTRGKRTARPTAPSAPPTPAAPPEPPKAPRFDTQAAIAGLDAAKVRAESSCKSATGTRLFVNMGFDPDGVNRGASVSDSSLRGTPEAKCVLRIFRSVRIPAFDLSTRPSGLGRPVRL